MRLHVDLAREREDWVQNESFHCDNKRFGGHWTMVCLSIVDVSEIVDGWIGGWMGWGPVSNLARDLSSFCCLIKMANVIWFQKHKRKHKQINSNQNV